MKINCIIAIDPGANGGIAVWQTDPNGTSVVHSVKMPKDTKQLQEYINYWRGIRNPIVFIEKLSVRPDDVAGDNFGKVQRITKMLANFEKLKALMELVEVPFVLVHPMKWQNALKLRVKGEEKAERKKRYKEVAQSYYPTQKVTMWNADALLIMHFARYILVNDLKWVKQQLPAQVEKTLFENT